MASRDLFSNVGVVNTVQPQVLTATNTSTGVDLAGFEGATVVINTGAIVGAGNMTPKLQDSANNSTWADVPAASLLGTFPAVLAQGVSYKVGYIGPQRYIRTVLTLNSGTSVAASATVLRSHARSNPVA